MTRIDLEANRYRSAIWLAADRRLLGAVPVLVRRARRRRPGVVARRPPAGLHQPAGRGQGREAEGHPARRCRCRSRARSSRWPSGTRASASWPGRRTAPGSPSRRASRTGRRRTTTQAAAAQDRPALQPARRRGLDDRPAEPHLRRPGRRLGAAAARHRRPLRGTAARRGRPTAAGSPSPSARHEDWDLERGERPLRRRRRRRPATTASRPSRRPITRPIAAGPTRRGRPTASAIAALTYDDGDAALFADVAVVDVATGEHTVLTADARPHRARRSPAPGRRSGTATTCCSASRTTAPCTCTGCPSAGGEPPSRASAATGASTRFDAAGGTLAFVGQHADDACPSVYVRDRTATSARLSDVGSAFHAAVPAARRPSTSRCPARTAPATIDAWIVAPDGVDLADRRRGSRCCSASTAGPTTQYALPLVRRVPAVGVAPASSSCSANPRGSTGQTHDWARSIRSPLAKVRPAAAGAASTTRT